MATGQVHLTRWLGLFADPAAERAFRADLRPRLAAQLRILAFLPGVYVAASFLDHRTFGTTPPFWWLAGLRLGVWTLVALAGALARPTRPIRTSQFLLFAGVSLVLVTEVVEYHLLALTQGPPPTQGLPFVVLFILGIYMMLPLSLDFGLTAGGLGTTLYLGYLLANQGPGPSAVGLQALYLLFANGVGLAFRITWNRIQRRDFALRTRLEREVAERKAAEAMARRATEAKNRFLASMSHEIRTPLNGVLGGVQLLRALPLTPDQQEPLDLVARSGELLARLLDDVLDLARMEAGRLVITREPFDPADLLAAVRAALQPQALAKGLVLRVEHGPLPPQLLGDPLRLRQVLVNLAGNAVKFTERGDVVVRLEASPAPEDAFRCSFQVADTGPGLDPEAQGRVFAPFEQGDMSTQRRHGGTGLGLTIARELVAAMGGDLSLESTPGHGCRFAFTLLLPRSPAPEAAPGSQAEPSTSRTILVVDDQEANRLVAAGLLGILGHRTVCVASGAEAMEILAARPFDAVLLDVHMQDMDGLATLRHLRANPVTASVPVYLCSADTEPAHVQAGLEAGAQGYLAKPLRLKHLAERLGGQAPASRHPSTDLAQRIRSDLGEVTWTQGLRLCRESLEACLEDLHHPARTAGALHRIKGLAATFGLDELHRFVVGAETSDSADATLTIEKVRSACHVALSRLGET